MKLLFLANLFVISIAANAAADLIPVNPVELPPPNVQPVNAIELQPIAAHELPPPNVVPVAAIELLPGSITVAYLIPKIKPSIPEKQALPQELPQPEIKNAVISRPTITQPEDESPELYNPAVY